MRKLFYLFIICMLSFSGIVSAETSQQKNDTEAPAGAIIIENGDESLITYKRDVFLQLRATDNVGITEMIISNDPTFNDAVWETYDSSKQGWLLTGGYGSKTVYVKYKDAAGNISSIYNDSIEFNIDKFCDVSKKHWAYTAVNEMYKKGVLSGNPDGTFKPNDLVTREQFAKMMVLTLQLQLVEPEQSSFQDLKKMHWSYKYVETAKNYLTGYQMGDLYYFKGGKSAVREDMAVALVKALKLENQNVDVTELDKIFKDVGHISPDLKKYVLIAYKNNLISGYKDDTFRAQGKLTRAEAASLLLKVLKSDAMRKVAM